MAKVDRKINDDRQAEKHSLSSFDKKRGAISSFNARTNRNKKYHVARVRRKDENIVLGMGLGKSDEQPNKGAKSENVDAPKVFPTSTEKTDSHNSESKPESAVSEH